MDGRIYPSQIYKNYYWDNLVMYQKIDKKEVCPGDDEQEARTGTPHVSDFLFNGDFSTSYSR
jgi:hypothetical protein